MFKLCFISCPIYAMSETIIAIYSNKNYLTEQEAQKDQDYLFDTYEMEWSLYDMPKSEEGKTQ